MTTPSSTIKSVKDVVANLAEKEFAEEFKNLIARKQLVKKLVALRSSHNVTQQAIADRLNCKQSKVSKLESGEDSSLTLEEIKAYADELGLELTIGMAPKDLEITDRIKLHAFAIKALLAKLVKTAQNVDTKVAEAIAAFHAETFFNMINIVADSAECLPKTSNNEPYVRIEIQEHPISNSSITLIPDPTSHLHPFLQSPSSGVARV